MDQFVISSPFGDEPLEEIHLRSAPLIRVIAQLRFPQLASMADDAVARALAREMGKDYPLFEEAHEVSLIIAGSTVSRQDQISSPVWRLQAADGNWRVTLGRGSLALEALEYAGRRDFCDRMVRLARAFMREAEPPRFDRFGVRYVNRITDVDVLAKLPELIRPEMTGAATLDLPDGVALHHGLVEAQFDRNAHSTLVRCGVLPAGARIDPTIPAANVKSWILDIDSAANGPDAVPLTEIENLSATLATLTERAYRFFRYAVNRDFLEKFGASE